MELVKNKFFIVTLLLSLLIAFLTFSTSNHPNVGLNITELVTKFGYRIESHEIRTSAGHILTFHRVPCPKKVEKCDKRVPVLVMHGMLQSSIDFVFTGPDKALGLILADKGFDVWLGNTRGTPCSRKHTKLNADLDAEYWNYTALEIGIEEVPASIDYILDVTKQKKLHYIGFSQGSAQFFIALSEKPEYASKIRLMTALAPTVIVKNITNKFVKFMYTNVDNIEMLRNWFGDFDLINQNGLIFKIIRFICSGNVLLKPICLYYLTSIHGDSFYINHDQLPVIANNLAGGTGVKGFVHSMQAAKTGLLKHYDYGSKKNLEVYGQLTPKLFDYSKITVPIAIFYAESDNIVNVDDIPLLQKTFPNVISTHRVTLKDFSHMDFALSDIAYKVVYPHLIKLLLKY